MTNPGRPFSIRHFLFFAFTFCLITCDLFTGATDNDLLKKIDEEIAWANAAKLNVFISYDQNWGTSNPPMGQITGNRDIRRGYEFDVEFIPDTAHTLIEWRAYSGVLETGWAENIAQFEIAMKERRLALGEDFILVSEFSPRGGKNTLKINTTGTITLVPWCETEPRITRTTPLFTPGAEFPRGTVISIYFNSQLDVSSVHDAVEIRNTTDNVDYSSRYIIEYFDVAGVQFITLTPKTGNLPEPDKNIMVTVKDNIANLAGNFMPVSVSYSWKTLAATAAGVKEFEVSYNSGDRTIVVDKLELTEGGYDECIVSYTINGGTRILLPADETIRGVGRLVDINIWQGTGVSGLQEYEIFVDIYQRGFIENSASVKIWNIPGMVVNIANTAYIDSQDALSAAAGDDSKITNIALTQDLYLHDWTPVNLGNRSFYGSGHTVTIGSFNSDGESGDIGLFAAVSDNALIRDLSVEYEIDQASVTGEVRFGGIAGTIKDTQLRNVRVLGGVALNVSGNTTSGGLVGLLTGTSDISNAYSSLNLTVMNGSSTGMTIAGGFAGHIETLGPVMQCYSRGNIHAESPGIIHAGGFAGTTNSKVQDCYALGNVYIDITNTGNNGTSTVGGLIGWLKPDSDSEVITCFAKGNVTAHNNGKGAENKLYAAGIVGLSGRDEVGDDGLPKGLRPIRQSVVLGESITATGVTNSDSSPTHDSYTIGRVYGNLSGQLYNNNSTDPITRDNFGYSGSGNIFASDIYNDYTLNSIIPGNDGSNRNCNHGALTSFINFIPTTFWKRDPSQSSVGFDSSVWDLSDLALPRGYPLLLGVGGQE
ncbi:MAG: hypothetical protein FWG99_09310 [Treponema sp.]|nr:hypothetical protein [Treponema sp.]